MLILAQNRTVLVNMDRINSIVVHNLGDNKFRILAYYGNENTDSWGIGDYETEERAKRDLIGNNGEICAVLSPTCESRDAQGKFGYFRSYFCFP